MSEVNNGTADLTCASTAAIRSLISQPNSRLRELAEVRSTAAPDTQRIRLAPTGAQGFDIIAPNWLGLFAPAGVPVPALRQLSAALAALQKDPAYIRTLAGFQAYPVSAEQATPDGLTRALRLSLFLMR